MGQVAIDVAHGAGIGTVVVASDGYGGFSAGDGFEELSDAGLDGTGIGSSVAGFQFGSAAFLVVGHPALAAEHAVGVVEEVAGIGLDGEVVMEGEVLAHLEGFEPVDDDGTAEGEAMEVLGLEKQSVAPETGDMVGNGRGGAAESASDLSVGHTADDHGEDGGDELRTLLPICTREGL